MINKKPLVSVIIQTYNRARFLKTAINSVLAQTIEDFEILIMDNASEDDTPELIEKYPDARIKYIRHENNIGRSENGKRALKLVQGEYFIFLSDDDYLEPFALEKFLRIFEKDSSLALVSSNFICVDENGRQIKKILNMPDEDLTFRKYEFIARHLRDGFAIILSGILWKRSIGLEIFNQESITEIILCCKLNSYLSIHYIAEPLFYYRVHGVQHNYEQDYISNQVTQESIYIKDILHSKEIYQFDIILQKKTLHEVTWHPLAIFSNLKSLVNKMEILRQNDLMPPDNMITERQALLLYFAGTMLPITGKKTLSVDYLYQEWRRLLDAKWNIGDYLIANNIRKVAIYGTLHCAYYLLQDVQRSGVAVECFLDKNKWHYSSCNIPIYHPFNIGYLDVDAILLSVEGNHDAEIKAELEKVFSGKIQIISWKELVKNVAEKFEKD